MAHSENYTEASPTDTTLSTSIDDEIVKSRRMQRERFAVDHKAASTDDGSDVYGVHKKITFEARIAQPTEPANSIATFYLKTGDYDAEIRFTDERDVDNLIVMVGEVKMILGSSVPGGWLALNGDTLGDSTSGADHAGDDYKNLFYYLYGQLADSEAPVSGGRTDVATDWNAHKTLTMPDARGRVLIGAGTGAGLTARTIGATGGGETKDVSHQHTAGTLENSHNHQWYDRGPNNQPDYSYDSNGVVTPITKASGVKDAGECYIFPYSSGGTVDHMNDFYTKEDASALSGSVATAGSATQDVMNPWIALTYLIKY